MSKARTLKFIDFIEAKRYFLQNRIFDEHANKSSKNHPQTLPKSTKNQHQITKNRQKSLQKCDFERRCPKIRPRTAPEAPQDEKSGLRPVGLTAGSELHLPGGLSFKELLFLLRRPGGKNSCEQARFRNFCCFQNYPKITPKLHWHFCSFQNYQKNQKN